jgi:hypothetical protein
MSKIPSATGLEASKVNLVVAEAFLTFEAV